MVVADVKNDTLKLELKAVAPTGTEGLLYYNSTSKKLQIHNGTSFVDISGGGFSFTLTSKLVDYVLTAADCNGTNIFVARTV